VEMAVSDAPVSDTKVIQTGQILKIQPGPDAKGNDVIKENFNLLLQFKRGPGTATLGHIDIIPTPSVVVPKPVVHRAAAPAPRVLSTPASRKRKLIKTLMHKFHKNKRKVKAYIKKHKRQYKKIIRGR